MKFDAKIFSRLKNPVSRTPVAFDSSDEWDPYLLMDAYKKIYRILIKPLED